MQAKNTRYTTTNPFFNGLSLFKQLLIFGFLTLSFNVNANIASGYEKVGDIINFIGLDYGVVKSDRTRRIWLDRNLGAEQVCESVKDENCYGDLYQWGRAKDGHQSRTSETTETQLSSITHKTDKFVIAPRRSNFDWTNKDKRGNDRAEAWKNNGVNTICPNGYSVPTIDEIREDTIDSGVHNTASAFESFLKIPAAGERSYNKGKVDWVGTTGRANLWSRTAYYSNWGHAPWAAVTYFGEDVKWSRNENRSQGFSVRCIQELH